MGSKALIPNIWQSITGFLKSDKGLEMRFGLLRSLAAILISIGMATILIFIVSDQPLNALYQLLVSPLTDARQFWGILERMIPFLFTGLAVCVMFSAKQFNLAAEGSVLLGAFVAALIAIYIPLPAGLHIAVAILGGALVSAAIMLIPSLLQTRLGANVLVSTLMLNFIILNVVLYFFINFFRDLTQGANMTYRFLETARIPHISHQTSWGIVIGLVMVVLVSLFMYRTKWGYAIRMVGINPKFAGYSGIKIAGILILCQVIGGFLAGMGGAVDMLGWHQRFRWQSLPGFGWNGITIAILVKNNPIFVPLGAFFLAYLTRGSTNMSVNADVPAEMLEVIQAIIFLFFAATHFLSKYRQKMVVKKAKTEIEVASEAASEEVSSEGGGGR
jgi:simple sugar transport system permease protein